MTADSSKFTAPRPDEEIHQGAEVPVTFGIDPSDGLPRQAIPDNQDRPPPLAVDTFVCMEDKRSFVVRHSDGSILLSFAPHEVKRAASGDYYVTEDTYEEHSGTKGVPNDLVINIETEDAYAAQVEPVRPACAHYLRVLTDISADRGRRFLSRSCAAQRSETGEYYSVGDAAIFACSMRMPRHLESEKILEDFDAVAMQESIDRVKVSSFDVDAELDREASATGLGVLG